MLTAAKGRKMKKIIAIIAIIAISLGSTIALAQQQVVWKIVLSSGMVLDFEYPNLQSCQTSVKSWPNGSCVAFPKSN